MDGPLYSLFCGGMMKIFHVADVHLGRTRLDGLLPDSDMSSALQGIADRAIDEQADVFLIAGDLFDRSQVAPQHLLQAQQILRSLKKAGIPVIAIEGNHDRVSLHASTPGWVNYLAEEQLLIHLQVGFGPDGAILTAWDEAEKSGGYYDYKKVRFIGAGYLGAATPSKLRQISNALSEDRTQVLLLHAGPDYFVGEGGGFSSADLSVLRDRLSYLALGHIHKPMIHDGWACNPGSPELCDLRETHYGCTIGRGYAVVELDDAGVLTSLDLRSNPRRPVQIISIDCTPFGNKTVHGTAELKREARRAIEALNGGTDTLIVLQLRGRLNLKRIALDPLVIGSELADECAVFGVHIETSTLNIPTIKLLGSEVGDSGLDRAALEKDAISTLVKELPNWGIADIEDDIAAFMYDLKEAVRNGVGDDALKDMIQGSSLPDRISTAMSAPDEPQTEISS